MMTEDVYTVGKTVDLKREMKRTLETPPLPASGLLRMMVEALDNAYGKARTLPKFMVFETLSREAFRPRQKAFLAELVRLHVGAATPAQEQVEEAVRQIQAAGDAEGCGPWPVLLWADLCQQRGLRLSLLKHVLLPRLLSFCFSCLTRIKIKENSVQAAELAAALASHAEHEYMLFAREHPEYETVPVESVWFAHYPQQNSLANLVRRVGLDKRDDMNHALEDVRRLARPVSD